MKRMILIMALLMGAVACAAEASGSFDDANWQHGPSDDWFVNWDKAVAESKSSGKPIFVLKTESDRLGRCTRLRDNVLNKPEFAAFARKHLVLLYIDSPKQNPLGEAQDRHNQQVVRRLTLGRDVPNATVVTADGERIGSVGGSEQVLNAYLKKLGEIVDDYEREAEEEKTMLRLPVDNPRYALVNGMLVDREAACIRWIPAKTESLAIPTQVLFTVDGLFSGRKDLKSLTFEGDAPDCVVTNAKENVSSFDTRYLQGDCLVIAYSDAHGWPTNGTWRGLPLRIVDRKSGAIVIPDSKMIALEQERRLVERHRQNPKLPRVSMPRNGRIADFDFDNWNLDDASGMGAKFVRGKWSQLGFRDGHLQIKRNEDEIGVSVPEITYDHFTVAMSFKALSDRTLSETIFRLGLKRGIAGPGSAALVFGASMVGGALEFDGCRADDGRGSTVLEVGKGMVTNEWNWLVCSVDAEAQRIDVVVNGVTFSGRLLNGMSWNASTHSNEQTFRGWGIAGLLPDDWIRGVRFGYFKGCLDDVILYNRALTESEMAAIAARTPCGQGKEVHGEPRSKPVEASPRPGLWLLTSGPERSFRWNDFITDGTNTLAVRREGQNLELAPLIFCRARGDVDLSKPIEDEKGMPYCLTATSQSYFDIFLEDCDQNDRVVRIKLPCSLEFCSLGVFSHLLGLKEIVFCGDRPKLAESRVAGSKFKQGHCPVVTAYADSKGWPTRGSFGGCPLKVVERPQTECPYVSQRVPQAVPEAKANRQGTEHMASRWIDPQTGMTWIYHVDKDKKDREYVRLGEGYGRDGVAAVDKATSGDLVIPESIEGRPVEVVEAGAFKGCSSLTSIAIPRTVRWISFGLDGAFQGCVSLTNFIVHAENPHFRSENGCLIEGNALCLAACAKRKSICVPDGVVIIRPQAFFGCQWLEDVHIPSNVCRVGGFAFWGCEGLKKKQGASNAGYVVLDGWAVQTDAIVTNKLEIVDGVRGISDWSFSALGGIRTEIGALSLPEGLQRIGENAFVNCGLKAVKFPKSLRYVGDGAFTLSGNEFPIGSPHRRPSREGLSCVTIQSEETSFTLPGSIEKVVFAAGILHLRKQRWFGKDSDYPYLHIVELPEGLVSIEERMFAGCPNLTTLTIPRSVSRIGRGFVDGCKKLTTITDAGGDAERLLRIQEEAAIGRRLESRYEVKGDRLVQRLDWKTSAFLRSPGKIKGSLSSRRLGGGGSADSGSSTNHVSPRLLGGSLRARRLQRQQEQREQKNPVAEAAQLDAERAEQRAQLKAIQAELKRRRESKKAVQESQEIQK